MGRPQSPLLSKRMIVETALALIDEVGLERFSIQQLAKRLGVRGPSIYHYFPAREDVLAAVAGLVLAQVHVPAASDRDWQEWLLQSAVEVYRAVAEHPNVAPLLLAGQPSHLTASIFEAALHVLRDAGLPPHRGLAIVDALEGAAVSWVLFGRIGAGHGLGTVDRARYPFTADALGSDVSGAELFEDIARGLIEGAAGCLTSDY